MNTKRKTNGQFDKGNISGQPFKKGQHWREKKPWWDKEWLQEQYIDMKKTTKDIVNELPKELKTTPGNIQYWLKKHRIPSRTMSETRSIKHWGQSGQENPMHGRTGESHPNWKGGCTPERQSLYSSKEWSDVCKNVWKRDCSTCQKCKSIKENSNQEFHIHHIISFAVKEKRTDLDNLILLCKECHNWVHSKGNIHYEYLQEN